jgi:imidazolonepropionase-like amidohydrolase
MTFTIHTSTLFDPKQKVFLTNASITVDPITGCVVKMFERETKFDDEVPEGDIDLRGKVVMPGFVDAHTHIFLHDYRQVTTSIHSEAMLKLIARERASVNQKRDESQVERILRAANHCRIALLAGYTTYR